MHAPRVSARSLRLKAQRERAKLEEAEDLAQAKEKKYFKDEGEEASRRRSSRREEELRKGFPPSYRGIFVCYRVMAPEPESLAKLIEQAKLAKMQAQMATVEQAAAVAASSKPGALKPKSAEQKGSAPSQKNNQRKK